MMTPALRTQLPMARAEALDPAGAHRPEQLPDPTARLATPAPCLVPAHQPYHSRSEQLRLLRTELLLRHDDPGSANLFTVVSAGPREGRSLLAAELAISFSQLGLPTLLVDADLRNPTQHLLFEAQNQSGLTTALARNGRQIHQGVRGLPHLALLTAGPTPTNPLELLSDRRFEDLVDGWRQQFQFVVLDTPPIGQYADALAVATITHRVLSLSRAGHTSFQDARNMMRRLAATRSRMLGAVLSHH